MWFYVALLTSLVSAFTVVINKKLIDGVSATVLTWATLVLATPAIALVAYRQGIPQLNILFVLGVTGSVILYTISNIVGFKAMRKSDLSAIYPLVSLGPIFTVLVAILPPLSERPSRLALFGVLVTLFGVYVLNSAKAREGIFVPIKSLLKNRASLLMIISVLVGSLVIIFDKLAINNTNPRNTTFTLLVENLMVILGLLPILYIRNRRFLRQMTDNLKSFLFLGVLNAISTVLAFSAVGGGNVGLVSTILKAQILFVLLLSYLSFKDKPKFEALVGSGVMIAGIVMIKLGS